MAYQTFGLFLVNNVLPDGYKLEGVVTKNVLSKTMVRLAKERPETYKEVILDMKKLGDKIATYDGISVGLDDIEPDYAPRNKILDEAQTKMDKAKTTADKINIMVDAQDAVGTLSMKHKGNMALMARSGGRGNKAQLMKSIASPVIVADQKGRGVPYLIRNSYAEGLTPGEYWIAGNEARQNVISGQLATAEPGAQSKILTNLIADMVIAADDCGTDNGISLDTESSDVIDRFTAVNKHVKLDKNTLVTTQLQQQLIKDGTKFILVRSPMTCILKDGVCKMCQGLDERGNKHELGVNVGIRAAHALSEPMTQLSLSAKHGMRLAKRDVGSSGLRAFVQYMEAPKKFPYRATISSVAGKVTRIEEAPQGGSYIFVKDSRFYVPVGLELRVRVGQRVEAGDALSEGIVYPPDVVGYKGMGAGREYLVNALKGQVFGESIDRRHLELVMKKHLNYVQIEDDDDQDVYLPGEVVDYNQFKETLRKKDPHHVDDSLLGEYLADDALHYTAGTKITRAVLSDLQKHRLDSVLVSEKPIKYTPVTAPMSRVPLYNPDWLQRLNHRHLKTTLLNAAHFGEKSDIHSLNPMPAYAYGAEFGQRQGPGY